MVGGVGASSGERSRIKKMKGSEAIYGTRDNRQNNWCKRWCKKQEQEVWKDCRGNIKIYWKIARISTHVGI